MIRVLIVEDDPMVAELNRRYLEQIDGFVLIAMARTVDEALGLLEKHDIDLVLLDIFIPGTNGLELLTQIREKGKDTDVIVVSAACDMHTIKKALRNGAVDYLIKPFEFERLNTALSDYRNQAVFMRNRDVMNQAELDRRILGREQQGQTELNKGLCRNTLNAVWENIRTAKGQSFTTEEMANSVGISRVSMRKYLDFLKQIDILSMEVVYGTVGRPVYRYRCINPESNIIKRYL
ncbi:response regulator [Sporomusa sp.]|uniref:response regulator n=1 Tax=Sporomusa sp. TaxID=2078658 RepID=UPI002C109E90|nr:response regulator [Sporomusa sp.]HWR41966.1 response regulator [Sporomusa sp.]